MLIVKAVFTPSPPQSKSFHALPVRTIPACGQVGGSIKFMDESAQISIVMPCLNEAETLANCIRKALKGISEAGIDGEVLIADNGSTDGSREIALQEGARIICIERKGYGNALRGGIEAAFGEWILIGDADDSYDFSNIKPFVEKLHQGHELVMGCRMPRGGGTVLPGAMPWKLRWIGNPILTFIGRLFFKCPANDFHCGMRAFTKEGYLRMDPISAESFRPPPSSYWGSNFFSGASF